MSLKRPLALLALAVAVPAAAASADTVQMRYVGTSGFTRSIAITVASAPAHNGNYAVGALVHEFDTPATGLGLALAGRTIQTWCIELEGITHVFRPFDVVQVADAPVAAGNNPNGAGSYGDLRSRRVHAVMGAAIAAGWIDSNLQLVNIANANTQKDRSAAIQLLVWESLFEPGSAADPVGWNLSAGNFIAAASADVLARVNDLLAASQALLDARHRVNGMRAVAGRNGQDQLVIIPLPPAAWASMGLLGAIGVTRVVRRRRQSEQAV